MNVAFGTPPEGSTASDLQLQGHSFFPTYFGEVIFKFPVANKISLYDVQTQPFDPSDRISATGDGYYQKFAVNTNGLADGYSVHFDLYTVPFGGRNEKAPFSHDAETGHDVPDGGTTVALLGLALTVLALVRRRFA